MQCVAAHSTSVLGVPLSQAYLQAYNTTWPPVVKTAHSSVDSFARAVHCDKADIDAAGQPTGKH